MRFLPLSQKPRWVRIVREPGYRPIESVTINSPADVARIIRDRCQHEENESVYVIVLDSQDKPIHAQEITRGTVNSSLMTPRDVFRLAITFNGAGVVLAHNHPSENPTPSGEDKAITTQLVAAGKVLDIPLYDHVIVTHDRFFSFQEAGLM